MSIWVIDVMPQDVVELVSGRRNFTDGREPGGRSGGGGGGGGRSGGGGGRSGGGGDGGKTATSGKNLQEYLVIYVNKELALKPPLPAQGKPLFDACSDSTNLWSVPT